MSQLKEQVSKDKVFVEVEIKIENEETVIYTNVECFLTIYVYKYLKAADKVEMHFVNADLSKGKIKINPDSLLHELKDDRIINKETSKTQAIRDLRLPIYQKDGNTFVAGMSSVCRQLVRCDSLGRMLLGFKESCLLAPAEASIWTRFCEVDITKAIYSLLCKAENDECIEELPQEITRFEKHMKQPVRMHNIYKLAREQALTGYKLAKTHETKREKFLFDNSTPKEELLIEHRFAEGVTITIADILLYPCIRLIFKYCPGMEVHFPLTEAWMNTIDTYEPECAKLLIDILMPTVMPTSHGSLRIVDCDACSLYKSDPKRYKPKNRIFTEQSKVNASLEKLHKHFKEEDFRSDRVNDFEETNIDWNTIEPAHEKNSALPQERLLRKRQQLENMANAVAAIAASGDRIVDFCSGTGHLGLLLALQLRECDIILIENKANSIERAKKRAKDLQLKNCHFYQCNIDYFIGNFDLAMSLHACGSATDIVIQKCHRSRAKFVCCPCCYGSLCSMEHLVYPLSKRIREVLSSQEFLYIAHAADQAHEIGVTNCRPETSLQGQHCMDIVDTDRKFFSEEAGYNVILTRLKPEQCTPKNHLLVGWHDDQCS